MARIGDSTGSLESKSSKGSGLRSTNLSNLPEGNYKFVVTALTVLKSNASAVCNPAGEIRWHEAEVLVQSHWSHLHLRTIMW